MHEQADPMLPTPPEARQALLAATAALLEAIAADEVEGWGGGEVTPVPYDTAWVAMVRSRQEPSRLAFPEALDWLLAHQAADGSWGDRYPHTLLPTMAGLLALHRAPGDPARLRRQAEAAEGYVRHALIQWAIERHESVGFEVVAPYLLQELEDLGLTFEFPGKDALYALYREKLLISGPELLYSGESNLIHSLEAFGPILDFRRLKSQQAANGSYGCSPAATAAVLMFAPDWDEAAAGWLHRLSERAFGGVPGGMPNAYPIDTFEGSWSLYNLAHGGLPFEELPQVPLAQIRRWLKDSIGPQGGSISRYIGIPTDADDTGMTLAALHHSGDAFPVDTLLPFEREGHFACFQRERGISMSANAHVLAALLSLPRERRSSWDAAVAKLTGYLFSVRKPEGYWLDKWHVSPYYATACSVLALAGHGGADTLERLRPAVSWIVGTQNADGGWGSGDRSTLEETACALQVLQACRSLLDADGQAAMRQGLANLWATFQSAWPEKGQTLPRLWLGKEVYTPVRVVFSAAIGALYRGLVLDRAEAG